jgi:preprotein translocase subunit SecD
MTRSLLYRILLFTALAVAAIVFLLPTFTQAPNWWPWQQPMRLGLDLRGGTHLLYAVDIDQAIANAVAVSERSRRSFRSLTRAKPKKVWSKIIWVLNRGGIDEKTNTPIVIVVEHFDPAA